LDELLIVLRGAHLAATAATAGALAFPVLVAAPAARAASLHEPAAALERRCLRIAQIGLLAAALSGLAWVLHEVAAMSGLPLIEAVHEGMVAVVLTQTQFGIVAGARAAIAALLAACLWCAGTHDGARRGALAAAAVLLASLAWTGHAAGTIGWRGVPHVLADALHLLAAGAWIGGLLPLWLLLASARRSHDDRWTEFAHAATRRFSLMGMASVAALVATGLFNAWILVGSFPALLNTEYGRLLVAKLALFAIMLGLAVVNRLYLTPRLAQPSGPLQAQALGGLIRNSAVEIGFGLIIFAIVGALGTLHPAIHLVPP